MKQSFKACLAGAVLFFSAFPAESALAHHHFLQNSFPEANKRVASVTEIKLRFEGAADAHFSTMKLISLQGTVIAQMNQPTASHEMVMTTPDLANGDYLVEYRVLARDGSIVQGAFEFTVDRTVA